MQKTQEIFPHYYVIYSKWMKKNSGILTSKSIQTEVIKDQTKLINGEKKTHDNFSIHDVCKQIYILQKLRLHTIQQNIVLFLLVQ